MVVRSLDQVAFVAVYTFGVNTPRALLHKLLCQITLEFGGGTVVGIRMARIM